MKVTAPPMPMHCPVTGCATVLEARSPVEGEDDLLRRMRGHLAHAHGHDWLLDPGYPS